MITGDANGNILFWRLRDGKQIGAIVCDCHQSLTQGKGCRGQPEIANGSAVCNLAFNPNGLLIVSGHYSGAVILWDAQLGRKIHNLSILEVSDLKYPATSDFYATSSEFFVTKMNKEDDDTRPIFCLLANESGISNGTPLTVSQLVSQCRLDDQDKVEEIHGRPHLTQVPSKGDAKTVFACGMFVFKENNLTCYALMFPLNVLSFLQRVNELLIESEYDSKEEDVKFLSGGDDRFFEGLNMLPYQDVAYFLVHLLMYYPEGPHLHYLAALKRLAKTTHASRNAIPAFFFASKKILTAAVKTGVPENVAFILSLLAQIINSSNSPVNPFAYTDAFFLKADSVFDSLVVSDAMAIFPNLVSEFWKNVSLPIFSSTTPEYQAKSHDENSIGSKDTVVKTLFKHKVSFLSAMAKFSHSETKEPANTTSSMALTPVENSTAWSMTWVNAERELGLPYDFELDGGATRKLFIQIKSEIMPRINTDEYKDGQSMDIAEHVSIFVLLTKKKTGFEPTFQLWLKKSNDLISTPPAQFRLSGSNIEVIPAFSGSAFTRSERNYTIKKDTVSQHDPVYVNYVMIPFPMARKDTNTLLQLIVDSADTGFFSTRVVKGILEQKWHAFAYRMWVQKFDLGALAIFVTWSFCPQHASV